MFGKAEEQILAAIATQLAEGKTTPDEISKLLNTLARFEERINSMDHSVE
jgi:hypothetical protein